MNRRLRPLACCLLALLSWSAAAPANTQASPRKTIRVMSFNLRYGTAKDGENAWGQRKDLVLETVKAFDADITGTQETLLFQAEFLGQALPDFTYVGRSRETNPKGEQCGILFRSERFDKLIEGHFWLSETPEHPGSKSWDSSLPRMATWVKLWDRCNLKAVYVLNTHFDHRGEQARIESAALIRSFLKRLPTSAYLIVMGDFNAAAGSEPHANLFADQEGQRSPVVDTYASLHPKVGEHDGTFNGFKGTDTGARIDWIGTSHNLGIVSAAIDRTQRDGRYPSDHFPVTAELSFDASLASR